MNIQALKSFISKLKPKYVVIFCHHNTDPDALYAANILGKLFRKLKPKTKYDIVPVGGLSSLTETMLNKVYVETINNPSLEKADFIALIDTNTLSQLDEWEVKIKESSKPIVIVDHHPAHPETSKLANLMLIDPDAKSACEFIFKLSQLANLKLNQKDSLGILFGILFETKGLRYGSSETFKTVYKMLEKGVKIEDGFNAFASPISAPERIARLKAASRLESEKVEGWILSYSYVGSYQASAARALIGLGADISIVGGEKKGKIRISLRAASSFYQATGIKLGKDVAFRLSEKFSGVGGGHATSAGFNGTGNLEEAILEAVSILKRRIMQVPKR